MFSQLENLELRAVLDTYDRHNIYSCLFCVHFAFFTARCTIVHSAVLS